MIDTIMLDAIKSAILSEAFLLTQPDRGDVFSWLDDHANSLAWAIAVKLDALAAATGTAKTAKQAECEASQSGGDSRNAQKDKS